MKYNDSEKNPLIFVNLTSHNAYFFYENIYLIHKNIGLFPVFIKILVAIYYC